MKRYFLSFMFFLLFIQQAQAKINTSYIKVSLKKIPPQPQLLAKVIPQRIYKLSSSINGRISSFKINTGENIYKNSFIANITSPTISSKEKILKKEIAQTKKNFHIKQSILNILQNEYRKHLISKEILLENKIKLEKTKTKMKTLQIKLQSLQAQKQLYSPVNGKIINVFAANGDYVKAGETILKIISTKNRLLVRVYGEEGNKIKIGQKGWFYPQQSSSPILVKVNAIIPNPNIPGTWNVYLNSVKQKPNWFTGEVGKFIFITKSHYAMAVPKKSLVMFAGKWWVLKKTTDGFQKIRVSLLFSNNNYAWIKGKNLNIGDRIIVSKVYQMFHENFSKNYEDPN